MLDKIYTKVQSKLWRKTKMKLYLAVFLMFLSSMASSRDLEFMEYFSVYSDYDVPSINLEMYLGTIS